MMTRELAIFVSALVLALSAGSVFAQVYPAKPVKVVVGFAPGGGTDIIARTTAHKLSEVMGQQFVVENRPGAGTTLASALVAKAPADGYTLLTVSSSYGTSASLYKSLSYDPEKDLVPVVLICNVPFAIVSHPSLPVKTVAELIAFAKARPGQVDYATSGVGGQGHLGGELFKTMAEVDLVHVPYKGSAPALSDVVGGRVRLLFTDLISPMPHVNSGQLRLLAVTTARRTRTVPNAPTVDEAGLPGYSFSGWGGLLAPAGTPREIIAALNNVVNRIITFPDVEQRLASLGGETAGGPPEAFAQLIRSDIEKWKKVVRTSNVPTE